MKNLRFNRIEKKGRCKYINDFQNIRKFGKYEYNGYIKCKLVHSTKYSLVFPDQIYFKVGDSLYWVQPLFFSANVITQFDEFTQCKFSIDISHGACLNLQFKDIDAISWLKDGSIFYKCKIKAPKSLYNYRTGDAQIIENIPYIKLFHHTSKEAKKNINKSNEYWSSNWNIQGTKKSTNISYLYLTSLPKISNIDDLTQIAISSQGKLAFRRDSNLTSNPDLILDVYRESTNNRTHTLSHWINTTHLSPQPCYKHTPMYGGVYYAIVSPFIHRIGVELNTTLLINDGFIEPKGHKLMDYTIVGDATTIDGLKAPYDEENTDEKLLIEYLKEPEEIMNFWFKNANTNQTNNKRIEELF
jgi:hypothetical protein